ncbi:MAG: NAD(P)/FAD-dependent oxidoreductase [Rhodococcus sp. (in: high G+C Gram-positive bacteria)]|jgi:ferredoxin/flavodoxin---NADP+ reductase|uniref:NAD(P)/FAD-dependent oxidoreductase n=1 Tax=Rhodococcus TaxID=1827 RepID=UPI0005B3ABFA|nr:MULTISPECIES: NAD(P)/FAD-dependent oxidoreductase [Rhodococcus]ANQ75425.1 ferredoxin--NADP(+) reductase [Rhodococcus sp. 008]ARE37678.1 ferredoxin--NADP(+) reductase [Rhodococcus sp. BH4]KSU65413.1 ferredoxin-NADP reductase [Rhodococcus qingshengii]KZF15148.1 ferredoxin--NADP(+) reductase [Rhodococcus sp. EPR-134]MCQ4151948.1 NAD(P)/FAD-dependent oxidoreductase [Rhodococcus qingshengii]
MASTEYSVDVDLLIVGAGPVGLYGAYYAGFRGLSVAVIDALPNPGGQITAMYPEKLIFDIAGFPSVKGQKLIDGLLQQGAPFQSTYLLGQQAVSLDPVGDRWKIATSTGLQILASAVVITAGVGSVSPRPLPCGEEFVGKGVQYFVPRLDVLEGQDVLVVGGGDSAVDWALASVERARSTTLVHRRKQFRAHAHSVKLLQESSCRQLVDAEIISLNGNGSVDSAIVNVKASTEPVTVPCTLVVAALGFTMQLGPLANWGLELENRSILVDTTMRTNRNRVFAAGDIATYPGKVKLIAVGFGEVASAVNNAAAILQPEVGLAPGHSSDNAPVFAAIS